jgi:radical SAM protein with 4Fe4S-binding SPASM domain
MPFRRSHINPEIILKNIAKVAHHPWILSKLIRLEGEKTFFNLLHPQKQEGMAGSIRQASIRITEMCNLRCHTCGQWGDKGYLHGTNPLGLKNKEVTPERYLQLLSDLVQNGHHPLVYFWGGEPMLYNNILDLIEAGTSLRLPVSIATNGTNLAKNAAFFVKAPLFLLQVSIDGHCSDLHNKLRPSASGGNNFHQIQEGLEVLNDERKSRGKNLPLIASLTVISRENVNHLVDIYKAFYKKVDMFVFYLSWWIDEENAKRHENDFLNRFNTTPTEHRGWIGNWKPEDYKLLDRMLKKLNVEARQWARPPVTIIPPVLGEKNLKEYYTNHREKFGFKQCISIFQAVEINSNGDLTPCRDYHDYVVGNVKESTITSLWNSTSYKKFRQSITTQGLMPVCSRCCGLMGY